MGHSTIADIDEIAGADLARLAETPTLDDMRQMDSEAKLRLLAYCVASQITSLSFHSDRDRQLAEIVGAAQIDMADKWEPNKVFYDQISKATLLKLARKRVGEGTRVAVRGELGGGR